MSTPSKEAVEAAKKYYKYELDKHDLILAERDKLAEIIQNAIDKAINEHEGEWIHDWNTRRKELSELRKTVQQLESRSAQPHEWKLEQAYRDNDGTWNIIEGNTVIATLGTLPAKAIIAAHNESIRDNARLREALQWYEHGGIGR